MGTTTSNMVLKNIITVTSDGVLCLFTTDEGDKEIFVEKCSRLYQCHSGQINDMIVICILAQKDWRKLLKEWDVRFVELGETARQRCRIYATFSQIEESDNKDAHDWFMGKDPDFGKKERRETPRDTPRDCSMMLRTERVYIRNTNEREWTFGVNCTLSM